MSGTLEIQYLPPKVFPFVKNGWTHELVQREGLVCIVRRYKNGVSEHFEVVRLRQSPERTFMRGPETFHVPAMETYPSDKDWGTYGFTFSQSSHRDPLTAAQSQFKKLCHA